VLVIVAGNFIHVGTGGNFGSATGNNEIVPMGKDEKPDLVIRLLF